MDTENTNSINMINVENEYEPVIYEQPINSHKNRDQFLLNYYTRSVSNSTTKEKIEKIVEEITEENPQNAQAQIKFIETYLRNHRYKREKNRQSHFF